MNKDSQIKMIPLKRYIFIGLLTPLLAYLIFKTFPGTGLRLVAIEIGALVLYLLLTIRNANGDVEQDNEVEHEGIEFKIYK